MPADAQDAQHAGAKAVVVIDDVYGWFATHVLIGVIRPRGKHRRSGGRTLIRCMRRHSLVLPCGRRQVPLPYLLLDRDSGLELVPAIPGVALSASGVPIAMGRAGTGAADRSPVTYS